MIGASRDKVFLAAAMAIVVFAIGAGLYVMGTPSDVRTRRIDVERSDDLWQLQGGIDTYWTEVKRLPASLEDTMRVPEWRELYLSDPETGLPYEYRVLDDTRFELCAVFAGSGTFRNDARFTYAPGRNCFTFDARPGALLPR